QEGFFKLGMELRKSRCAQQPSRCVVMALLERPAQSLRGISVSGSRSFRHDQQLIGDFRHGADHDDRLLPQAAFHALRRPGNCRRVFYRRSAKLHYDHRERLSGNEVKEENEAEDSKEKSPARSRRSCGTDGWSVRLDFTIFERTARRRPNKAKPGLLPRRSVGPKRVFIEWPEASLFRIKSPPPPHNP